MSGIDAQRSPRCDHDNRLRDELVIEWSELAGAAGVLTLHMTGDGSHASQIEAALCLGNTSLSPPGVLACNAAAPDEGSMCLLGKVDPPPIKKRLLKPPIESEVRGSTASTAQAIERGKTFEDLATLVLCPLENLL